MPKRLPKEYFVERIIWGGGTKANPMRVVRWKDFSHRGDTWEPREDLVEQPALDVFEALPRTLLQSLFYFRSALYGLISSQVINERTPVNAKRIVIDAVRHEDHGRALMHYLAEETGIELTVGDDGLNLDCDGALDKISEVCALHTVKKENAFGCLRIKCGAASYTDMIGISALDIYFHAPPVAEYTYSFSGYKLEALVTTCVVNGLTGTVRYPKMPMPTTLDPDAEEERYTQGERNDICQHFKAELLQQHSTLAIPHPLRAAGWCALAKGNDTLPIAVSIPGPRKRRPEFERKAERAEKVERRAARSAQAAAERKEWRGREQRASGRP